MKLTNTFNLFFKSEKAGGILLIIVTAISLLLANSAFGESYIGFWRFDVGGHSITHWINDGLMTIFFLLIGLELERELYKGELSDIRNAYLPILAAIGGILVPAGIYLMFNVGTIYQRGMGIPMATDIAFAIGVLSLLGKRVPAALKVFLTALAIIDDLGAIIIIAVFYSKGVVLLNLFIALAVFVVLVVMNRMKVNSLFLYLLGGVIMWYFMLNSGVHATITGVLLAFAIPFGDGSKRSVSYKLEHFLHKPVAFLILPLFALANTGIALGSGWMESLSESYSYGVVAGLAVGKPLGIFLFSLIGVVFGICSLPRHIKWMQIIGVGFLAGIGFTMSIFIAILAYENEVIIDYSKIAILAGSLISGIAGFLLLKLGLKKQERAKTVPNGGCATVAGEGLG